MTRNNFKSIDEYIGTFSDQAQLALKSIRQIIRKAAPEAKETISYRIPTFTLNGNLVHFAAFRRHIGFYPTPGAIKAFQNELSGYKQAKGSVQFPLNKPLPLQLIQNIVEYRVKENVARKK